MFFVNRASKFYGNTAAWRRQYRRWTICIRTRHKRHEKNDNWPSSHGHSVSVYIFVSFCLTVIAYSRICSIENYLGANTLPKAPCGSAENGRIDLWVWGGMFPLQPTNGLGASWTFQRGPGWSPGRKHILAYIEGQHTLFLHLYVDAMSSSNSVSCHIWGARPRFGTIAPALM